MCNVWNSMYVCLLIVRSDLQVISSYHHRRALQVTRSYHHRRALQVTSSYHHRRTLQFTSSYHHRRTLQVTRSYHHRRTLWVTWSYHQYKWKTSLISILTWNMTDVVTCTSHSTQNGCKLKGKYIIWWRVTCIFRFFFWDRCSSERNDDISPVLVLLRQKQKTLVMARTTCGQTDFYERCQLNESDCNQATAVRSTCKEYHRRIWWIKGKVIPLQARCGPEGG